jgi:ABC-type Mn2+/Zn2+ transport system permease subunit
LKTVIVIAVGAALASAVVGVAVNAAWRFVPTGPAIVLTLFVEFAVVYVATRFRSSSAT